MTRIIVTQLMSLAFTAAIAALVWLHYRKKISPLHEKYSTFGPRFWTGSIDSCVLWPLGFAVAVLFVLDLPGALRAGLFIGQNLVWLGYTVLMHARYGQTVGKMTCKVRVVDHVTEGPLSFRQALLREGIPISVSLVIVGYEVHVLLSDKLDTARGLPGSMAKDPLFWVLSSLPLLWFIAEALTMLTNEKRRALHDFIAGTVVVRTNLEAPKA